MKRDYGNLVDVLTELEVNFDKAVREKIQETIEKDNVEDAVDNIMEIINEIKYEF